MDGIITTKLWVLLFLLCLPVGTRADTIHMADGAEEKGIVVENYHDRILLSTAEGEKEISKKDIKDITYDRQEQNLVKLGDFHEEKGNLLKAYEYFQKAYELNPDYKEAGEKFMHLRSIILRQPEVQMQDAMSRRRALFKEAGKVYDPTLKKEKPDRVVEQGLRKATGLTLIYDGKMPKVSDVAPGSSAQNAGIRKGDFIFTIWGRLTGYMNLEAIYDMLLTTPSPEILISIKRRIDFLALPEEGTKDRYKDAEDIGFSLIMDEGGLTIEDVLKGSMAENHSLQKSDLITAINDQSTRYLPLGEANRLINKNIEEGKPARLDVIREVALWRKDD